ncbi:hypothetical protein H1C71_026801, partial [Ictidomys tridecemlineatus]
IIKHAGQSQAQSPDYPQRDAEVAFLLFLVLQLVYGGGETRHKCEVHSGFKKVLALADMKGKEPRPLIYLFYCCLFFPSWGSFWNLLRSIADADPLMGWVTHERVALISHT